MPYTKEQAILALRTRAAGLGRTPSVSLWAKERWKPSYPTIAKLFGSWNDALAAAGLPVNNVREYSKEEIIGKLRDIAAKTGKIPTNQYWNKNQIRPSTGAIARAFGSWNSALKAAGFGIRADDLLPDDDTLETLRSKLTKINYLIKVAVDSGRIMVNMDTGTIFSLTQPGLRLSTGIHPMRVAYRHGRKVVTICIRDDIAPALVHRIVAYVKFGDALFQEGIHVHHINDDPLDNRADNLELLTSRSHLHKNHFYGNHVVVNPKTGKIVATFVSAELAREYSLWKFGC